MERIEKERERFGLTTREQRDYGTDEQREDEELDLLPEFCDFRDEGCELAGACLECPFPDCIHGQFRGGRKQSKNVRDAEIMRLYSMEKTNAHQLSQRFNLSLRTVRRVLASGRKNNE